jgi:DNA-binding NarL/FixJ family response regulator
MEPVAMSIQILIVDDHQIVREGVQSLLKMQRPAWSIVEAGDGPRALEFLRSHSPDLVIMDITMPGLSGLEVVHGLREAGFNKPILMFTMHKSGSLAYEAEKAGAQGFVLKSQAVEDLVLAIDTLLAGGTFYGAPATVEGEKPSKPDPKPMFFLGLSPAFA